MTASARAVWAPLAWVGGAWQKRVLLDIDARGRWSSIEAGIDEAPDGASVVSGPALPGVVNAHSHAFQRACRRDVIVGFTSKTRPCALMRAPASAPIRELRAGWSASR